LDQTITKDILRSELYGGERPAAELLYSRYSGMLYSYILQFVPDRTEAGTLLVDIFSRLTLQLQEAFDSSLSVYCWLQVESRKIILEYIQNKGQADGPSSAELAASNLRRGPKTAALYFLLLEDAPPEHQWVFRELFLYGRSKEDLALHSGKDLAYVSRLLRECLGMIRKNLG
jgi:DNA-directed RNA polymerase specialized sigma24 family protein